MGDRLAKDALFDGFATVAKAMANGHRAELIDVLAQGERHVEELASEIGQSVANTSHHLQSLAAAGLVTTRRVKTRIYYRLASSDVEQLWSTIRTVALAHVGRIECLAIDYVGNRDALEEISREELSQRLDDGDLIIVDVRPRAEYEAGHIAGARSIPMEDLASTMSELPSDTEIVAYCRGPFCVFADDAVRLLQSIDRNARRLQDGFPEWRTDRLPVVAGPDD